MLAITAPIRSFVLQSCQMMMCKLDQPAPGTEGVPELTNEGYVPSCHLKGCDNPNCYGNVVRIPIYGQDHAVVLTWNHHKTGGTGANSGRPIITKIQDPRVRSVLQYWYKWGHPILYYGNPAHQPTKQTGKYMFMHYNTQSGMPTSHVESHNYTRWLRTHSTTQPGVWAHHSRHAWSTIMANTKVGDA
jgi:hypothetical protein